MNTICYCVAELWRTANYTAKVLKSDDKPKENADFIALSVFVYIPIIVYL